jgi:hypothetical protein
MGMINPTPPPYWAAFDRASRLLELLAFCESFVFGETFDLDDAWGPL